VFADRRNPRRDRGRGCGLAPRPAPREDRPARTGAHPRRIEAGRRTREAMKKLGALVVIAIVVLILTRARDRAVHSVNLARPEDAVERAKGISALEEKRELDRLANPGAAPGRAQDDAIDRTPFHFLAVSPAGRYVRVAGALTFHASDAIRLVLEIHPSLVAADMPDPLVKPGEPNRPDRRPMNTSFEVTADEGGTPRPAPFWATCSLAPEPSDLAVALELGGNRDARDAAAKRIHMQELSGRISSAQARDQLAALNGAYVPNTKGTYQVRAVYGHGRLATAPITIIITD